MALDPKVHIQIIGEPQAFLDKHKDKLIDPLLYFIDHAGRHKPLVAKHADGVPLFQIEDDGTLKDFEHPKPDPNAKPTVVALNAVVDFAKLSQ